MVKFDLIVEGKLSNDPTVKAPHDLELMGLTWESSEPPDIVIMPGGIMLLKVSRYASNKERWMYRIAKPAMLVAGRLEPK